MDSASKADLVLYNANVLTLDESRPRAEAVAVRSGRIVLVGSDAEARALTRAGTRSIDCSGQTLVPGFVDAHIHLMAYAASIVAVDCRPSSVDSMGALVDALRTRAAGLPLGRWVRGSGYDEATLGRHPTRWELDQAAPGHPVRLDHRSGHACVLNSMAMEMVGIGAATDERPGVTIGRDLESGELNGLVLEPAGYLDGRIPPLGDDEMERGIRAADRRLLSAGITSLHDASPSNSPAQWEMFSRLKAEARLTPRLTAMAGVDHLDRFAETGLGQGSGDDGLRLSHAKIMLTASSGRLHPSRAGLDDVVSRAHEAGFPVAVHAVEADAVDAAAETLASARGSPSVAPRDRIEHLSECSPKALESLAASGAMVVTQPSFIYQRGGRYLSETADEVRPWLYRIGSVRRAGVAVAMGSDAPVAEPDPPLDLYAAVTRRAESGETVGGGERVSPLEALWMYTMGGALASGREADLGSIEVGKLADLVLLDGDPTRVEMEELRDVRPLLTVVGGKVAYER